MSHTVKISAQFRSEQFQAFKRAIEKFGWKLIENSKIRTYRNDPARDTIYPMIAQNPNSGFDLGLRFNEATGELEVLGDFYDGSVAQTLGRDLDKLKQEYSCQVIEDHFTMQGYVVNREVNAEGLVTVTVEN
jgi:hypothetical protein